MEPIRLSALGLDVHVGNLYNYFNDDILTDCAIRTLKQNVEIHQTCEVKHDFFFHQLPIKYKRQMLGINSHLDRSIEGGTMDVKHLWFADYLEWRSTPEDDNLAQVDAIFHIARRTEILNQHFDQQKMFEYQLTTDGKATHSVEKVVYGVELVISMRRALDLNSESKASAEGNIYLAARTFYQQIIDSKVCNRQRPAELDKINCTIFSSIDPGNVKNGTFEDSCKTVKDAVSSSTANEDKWKPIEMTLKDIPAQIEVQIWSEKTRDVDYEKKKHLAMLKAIIKESNVISKDPSIIRVPPLEKAVYQFLFLLASFQDKIESFHSGFFVMNMQSTEQILSKMKPILDLLMDMTDWLIRLRKEIVIMCSILSNTQLSMNDLEEIRNSVSSGKEKRTRVFILKMDYSPDPLMDRVAKFIGNQESFKRPVFSIATSRELHIEHVNQMLKAFNNKNTIYSSLGFSYQIGLVPISSSMNDGSVIPIGYTTKDFQEITATQLPDRSIEPSRDDTEDQLPISDPENSTLFPEGKNCLVPTVFNKQTTAPVQQRYEKPCGASTPGIKPYSSTQERLSHQPAYCEKETVCGATGRVAEIFAQETNQYAKLIKRGQPNVYLLNANEKLVKKDLRWFNIDKPGAPFTPEDSRDHKVIILMGANGCGKSALINGMVNYILGVQWDDPYRFKCIRDDETIDKNQAHSQTSLVTAYTLRHHEGMAIPYSITIIDTPGYGETKGVQRDKEITSNIHRFLTREETRVNEIHSASFLAASGDDRLTAIQRNIIDSVLSIFAKNVKHNMRLLVTFADKDDPPVVETCLADQFPVISASVGIDYSKFHSSVLYVSNEKRVEDDFSFNGLFWDMGQENFVKFFAMLEGMTGGNVKSTREVLQRRQQLEQSLKDIEFELEDSLSTIENMEMIRRELGKYSHNMESNTNFVQEKRERKGKKVRNLKVKCDKGFSAYNCNRCKKTCEKPAKIKNFEKRKYCTDEDCHCSRSSHVYRQYTLVPTSANVTTKLRDMEAEFEANFNQKLTNEKLEDELNMAKGKVFNLLEQVGTNVRLLDSTDLRSNALSPDEYLSFMRSRVLEEQAPGYLIRLQTLTELQESLNAPAVPSITGNTDKLTFPVTPTQPEQTGNPGSKFESTHSGTEKTSSRPAQQSNFVLSQLLSTGTAVAGTGARSEMKNKTAGMDGTNSNVHGVASTPSSSIQRMSQETNMDKEAGCVRNIPSPKEESSSYVYSGSQVVHPPDATENYFTASKETLLPCQTKKGESNQECEVSPSYHRGEKDGLSSSDEEMEQRNTQSKTTDELVQSIISKFWSSR